MVSALTKLNRNNALTDIDKRVVEWQEKFHALTDEKKKILEENK